MHEYRFTLQAERPDGGVAALAVFVTKDLADVLAKTLQEKHTGFTFEICDEHQTFTTEEFLSDDNNFD